MTIDFLWCMYVCVHYINCQTTYKFPTLPLYISTQTTTDYRYVLGIFIIYYIYTCLFNLFICSALELYESGMQLINGSRTNKGEAYKLLMKASELGNTDAKVMVAWAKLFGTYLPQNLEEAKVTFQELANVGVPDGHMVSQIDAFMYVIYTNSVSVNSLWCNHSNR